MTLSPGTRLGPYEVQAAIGAGGMGEVYKAKDTRLDRVVALKVLPAHVSADRERQQRFAREAKALAALNHPGIVTIHSIEEAEGVRFLTMEFVEGRPLSWLIGGHGLPVDRLLDVASLLAAALAAAHEKGVIHRDLKPANVMIGEDGQVKVLDFGLAKLREPNASAPCEEETRALLTGAGQLLGTTPYLSPEQIQGRPIDNRADVFALGTVMFEMACGKRPFTGESAADICTSILRDTPPPVSSLEPGLPPGFDRIVQHCLQKDPSRRYQSALDVRNDLDELKSEIATTLLGMATAPPVAPALAVATRAAGPSTKLGPLAFLRRPVLAAVALISLVVVALVTGVALGVLRVPFLGRSAAVGIRSLAVLPFVNQMGDATQDYFVEGMHEALITELTKLGTLEVKSRQTVIKYKGSERASRDIANELGVGGVIEGSVLRLGDTVRISATLVDGKTGAAVWARAYERDLAAAMPMLGEVTRAIADQIDLRLTADQRARLTTAHTVNAEAQDYYLRGRQQLLSFTPPGITEAARLFQQAIGIDPTYARAYAGLSICQALPGMFGLAMPADVAAPARASAMRAIELDDQAGEAHVALGMVKVYFDWDWEGGCLEARRGAELTPSDWIVYRLVSECQLMVGDRSGAVQTARVAREIDPASVVAAASVVSRLLLARRFEEALHEARRLEKTFKGTSSEKTAGNLASINELYSLWLLGRRQEALDVLRTQLADDSEALDALNRGARVDPLEAIRALARTDDERARRKGSTAGVTVAGYYGMVGDADGAMPLLEHAFTIRARDMMMIGVDPLFDPIRSDPRFVALVARMRFPSPVRQR